MRIVLFFLFIGIGLTSFSQEKTDLSKVKLTKEEMQLYDMLMTYRKSKRLPAIPLSASLTHVAQTHVRDLAKHNPDAADKCNMHSWSDQGPWSSCCYTRDHKQARCMWDKPKELTNYQSNGYEISYTSSGDATPEKAMAAWKKSSGHNEVMVNKGIWKDDNWQAVGIGIFEGRACIWFGKEADSAGAPLKP